MSILTYVLWSSYDISYDAVRWSYDVSQVNSSKLSYALIRFWAEFSPKGTSENRNCDHQWIENGSQLKYSVIKYVSKHKTDASVNL